MTPAGFALATIALAGGDPPALAVAVSGGPDSLALLWLAHRAFPGRVHALTVDHGLQPHSAADAAGVGRLCRAIDVPHSTLLWQGEKPDANVQAAARAARYALLHDWCAAAGVTWLATGHHADDQAETLLMRLARGSGSAGLSGIRPHRRLGSGVQLIRPLLGMRRVDLAAIVAAAGWTAVDDPANRSPRFQRTRARVLLAATPWLAAERLAASAAHLADAEAALDWAAALAWGSRATVSADRIALDAAGLPPEIVRRLLVRVIAELAHGVSVSGPAVARWQVRLGSGGCASLGGIAGQGGAIWHFRRAAPRR